MSTFPCDGYSRSIVSFVYLETIFRINIIEISIIVERSLSKKEQIESNKEKKIEKVTFKDILGEFLLVVDPLVSLLILTFR
jgi:hypothetical protein